MRAMILAAFVGVAALSGPAWASGAFDQTVALARAAMMSSPQQALAHADAAALQADPTSVVELATAQWLRGQALYRLNRASEALQPLRLARDQVAEAAPDSHLFADLLMAHAYVLRQQGAFAEAFSEHERAYQRYVVLDDVRNQAIALHAISSIYVEARDFDRALTYLERAGDIDDNDPAIDLAIHNSRGNAYSELGRYREAVSEFEQALDLAQTSGSAHLQVRVLANLADVQLKSGSQAQARLNARAALAIAESAGVPEWSAAPWGTLAALALEGGDLDGARVYIDRAFAGVDLGRSNGSFRHLHALAGRIFEQSNDWFRALEHWRAFMRLDAEARELSSNANAALMAAQFEFAQQQSSIARLRADALVLRAQQRDLITNLGFVGMFLLLLIILLGYRNARRGRVVIEGKNAELNATNDELIRALSARSEFLATTSHEIRTPLNGILGMTQVLMCDETLSANARDRVRVIHGAGQTMRALVDDILDLAKIERGELRVYARAFNLRDMLEEVAGLWKASAEEKGLTLSIELNDCPELFFADERRLRQIVFNLLSNAVKFTAHGEIAVEIAVRQEGDERCLEIAVRDTGIGIPADELEEVFAAFYQIDGSTTRQHGGTGVGLAISRQLAHALSGELRVASELGRGSVFTLVLPCASCNAEKPANDAEGPLLITIGASEAASEAIRCELEEHGLAISGATGFDHAATMWANRKVSMVVVDGAVLSGDVAEAVQRLFACSDAVGEGDLVIVGDAFVQSHLLRLCGVQQVETWEQAAVLLRSKQVGSLAAKSAA